MGKGFRSLTAEREWDGKAGSPLVDRTGRECTIFGGTGSWNSSGTGWEFIRVYSREIGREHSREISGEQSERIGREIVGETVGNTVKKSVGNVVGIWLGDCTE